MGRANPEYSFQLASIANKDRIIEVIGNLPADGTYDIDILKHRADRSIAQLRLKWLWCTEYGAWHGITKDEANRHYKWMFMRPILIRDDPTGAMKELFSRATGDPAVTRRFVDLIHTEEMTMAQMAESLTDWDLWAGPKGIIFSHPEDLYWAVQMEGE